jgi:lincosamide and streptogramin A transport system ATP-binding/permease protein
MGTINITDLTFSYPAATKNLFENCTLKIDESWSLGLIGRNGRGKTTFLQLLMGKHPHQGTIQTNLKFSYFPPTVLHPQDKTLAVLNAVSQLDPADFWQVQAQADQLGISAKLLARPFFQLSPGEQTRALLAAVFADQNTFQLIDEPTNHLDLAGRQAVSRYLQQRHGFIVISHDQHFIDQIVDHILAIERQKLELLQGNYSTWQAEFSRQNCREQLQKEQLTGQIKQLKQTATQTKLWAKQAEKKKHKKNQHYDQHAKLDKGFLSHRAAKLMKRSKTTYQKTQQVLQQKQDLLQNYEEDEPLTMNYQASLQPIVLRLTDLQVKQNGQPLNQPLSLTLKRGQRLALVAPNGFGKTTLLRAILNEKQLISQGQVEFQGNVKISYLAQNFEQLHGSLSTYAEHYQLEPFQLMNVLHKLGVERFNFGTDLAKLSLGQRKKISLARSLAEKANLYFWDEPLNYLDAITRQQLTELLLTAKPTMLLIEHDAAFVKQVAIHSIKLKRP